jgi:hypothetical protein
MLCPIKVKNLEAVLECCFQHWLEESMLSIDKCHIDNTAVAINVSLPSDSSLLNNDIQVLNRLVARITFPKTSNLF